MGGNPIGAVDERLVGDSLCSGNLHGVRSAAICFRDFPLLHAATHHGFVSAAGDELIEADVPCADFVVGYNLLESYDSGVARQIRSPVLQADFYQPLRGVHDEVLHWKLVEPSPWEGPTGLKTAGLGAMPGAASYRFTHNGVENPDRSATMGARITILLGSAIS